MALDGVSRRLVLCLFACLAPIGFLSAAEPLLAALDPAGKVAWLNPTSSGLRAIVDPVLPPADPSWAIGDRRVLVLPVGFTDLAAPDPQPVVDLIAGSAGDLLARAAHRRLRLRAVALPAVSLNATAADFQDPFTLASRAVAASGQSGASDERLLFLTNGALFSWAGLAELGGRRIWINAPPNLGLIAHELGHSLGMPHSGAVQVTGEDPTDPGQHLTYGDPTDVMGSGGTSADLPGAAHRFRIGWLPETAVLRPAGDGVWRLWSGDDPRWRPDRIQAMALARADGRTLWIELHGDSLRLVIAPGPESASELIDATPWTATFADAGLTAQRVFEDRSGGWRVALLRSEATDPPSALVAVRQRWSGQPSRPPRLSVDAGPLVLDPGATLTANAIADDLDGPAPLIAWDAAPLGGGAVPLASAGPAFSATFFEHADRLVRCSAGDLDGGLTTAWLAVTVGSPGTGRIAGTVLADDVPVSGVRVMAPLQPSGRRPLAWTDSRGEFLLTGLLPDSGWPVSGTAVGWTIWSPASGNIPVGSSVGLQADPLFGELQVVASAGGVPVAGATVRVAGRIVGATAADGRLTVTGLPREALPVTVGAPGRGAAAIVAVAASTTVNLTLADDGEAPAAPAGFAVAAAADDHSLEITWRSEPGVVGYELTWSAQAPSGSIWLGTTTETWADPGLIAGASGRLPAQRRRRVILPSALGVWHGRLVAVDVAGNRSPPAFTQRMLGELSPRLSPITVTQMSAGQLTASVNTIASAIESGSWQVSGPGATSVERISATDPTTVRITVAAAGDYRITAAMTAANGLDAIAETHVTIASTAVAGRIDPPVAMVSPGAVLNFSARWRDGFATERPPEGEATWTVTGGGRIDVVTGQFIAGAAAGGPWTVQIVADGLTATAQVSIINSEDDERPCASGAGLALIGSLALFAIGRRRRHR
ncbi:hypothetical protein LBMAG53_15730 [Planctomycetota bacterium]|nr:hypothetical protein LBMAG53_15730 [Planctomycetota bacterium]